MLSACTIIQAGVGDAEKREDMRDEVKFEGGVYPVLYLTSLG
jgi:hypothetical protein